MTKHAIIAALPVGEFDSHQIKDGYAAILRAFDGLGCDLSSAAPAADVESAARAVRELSRRDPDLQLIVPLRGLSAETIAAAARSSTAPCLIIPLQGRYALPSSALAVGALREEKLPVELLYAPPEHPEFVRKLGQIVRAAQAYSQLRRSRIGIVGGLFPNLVSCRYDADSLSSTWGVSLLPIAFEDLRNAVQAAARQAKAARQAMREISAAYRIEPGARNALAAGVNLHLALKSIAQEQKLDGFAAECWSGFPAELGLNPCLGFVEDAYTLACEGDVLLGVALLAVHALTGSRSYVGDLYELDMDGRLTLIHCGAPASLCQDKKEVVVGRSQLALERGFETLTCRPRLEPGPVTVLRLYGPGGEKVHLAAGEITACEQSPTLSVHVHLAGDRWNFLEQALGNHYVVAQGDVRAELKLLCKWRGVTVFET